MSAVAIIIALFVGLAVGFGAAIYAAATLLRDAAAQLSEANSVAAGWRKLAQEKIAHLDHVRRMLQSARSRERPTTLALLGLDVCTTEDDVNRTFRRMVAKAHPDRGGDPDVFRLVVRVKDAAVREVRS
jgi:hypothetical protein